MARAGVVKGYKGKVSVDGTTITAEEWTHDGQADDIPALSFEDYNSTDGVTYDDGTTGVVGATVTVKGYWDSTQYPNDDPPGIYEGAILSTVRLYIDRTAPGIFYEYAALRVLQCRVGTMIRGRAEIQFTAKSCGQITYPT